MYFIIGAILALPVALVVYRMMLIVTVKNQYSEYSLKNIDSDDRLAAIIVSIISCGLTAFGWAVVVPLVIVIAILSKFGILSKLAHWLEPGLRESREGKF